MKNNLKIGVKHMSFKIESLIGKRVHNMEKDEDIPQILLRDDDLFYCININCLLIIKKNNVILTTSRDILDSSLNDNPYDKKINELFSEKSYLVEDISINAISDCTIILSDNIIIDLFVNTSAKGVTLWELFEYDEHSLKSLFKIET